MQWYDYFRGMQGTQAAPAQTPYQMSNYDSMIQQAIQQALAAQGGGLLGNPSGGGGFEQIPQPSMPPVGPGMSYGMIIDPTYGMSQSDIENYRIGQENQALRQAQEVGGGRR